MAFQVGASQGGREAAKQLLDGHSLSAERMK